MKIIVIGATGTIGKAVAAALEPRHEVVRVGYNSGDFTVDIGEVDSINALFQAVGRFDALVSTAGAARFGTLDDLSESDFLLGLNNKLMGQINLVRLGRGHVNDNGSFTLTSGVLSGEPIPGSSAISPANAGVEGFTRAAALEMTRGVRVNTVSPVFVSETLAMMGMDAATGMPAAEVAQAYVHAVEGGGNREVVDVRSYDRG